MTMTYYRTVVMRCGLALALALLAAGALAEPVRVTPGGLDHFVVTVIGSPEAGERFAVRIEACDAFENLVADYSATGRGVRLAATGRGALSPAELDASLFKGGAAIVELTYPVAEEISLRATERGGTATGAGSSFIVRPADPDRFEVTAPPAARAGEPFTVTVVVFDRFGNLVTDYDRRSPGVTVTASGVGKLFPTMIAAREFAGGRATLTFKYDTAEEIRLLIRDQERPATGSSGVVRISAGAMNRFVVTAPHAGRVGEPFTIALEAKDAFGNTVFDYAVTGRGAELSVNGTGRISPEYVEPVAFVQGVAFVTLLYTKSENVMVFARERSRDLGGSSGNIVFSPGSLASFEVEAPAEAEAGASFALRLRAIDRYGNIIRNYDRTGGAVKLTHDGTLPEGEQELAPTAFIDGTATVNVLYRLAERLIFTVKQADGPALGAATPVTLRAGALDHFRLELPETAQAGIPFTVGLVAEDRFNNRIADFARRGSDVVLATGGTAAREPVQVTASRFTEGKAQVIHQYTRAEKIVLRVEDRDGSVRGVSLPLTVAAGPLAGFTVIAPEAAQAGETFPLKVIAIDAYANVVENYAQAGHGVRVASNGVGTVVPVTVPPAAFVAGVALVDCLYYSSEMMSLTVTEEHGLAVGTSSNIRVKAGPLDHFLVTAPARITAGEVFALRVEAQDRYFNTLRDYLERGERVELAGDGAGRLIPAELVPADFGNGVATLNVTYDRAGTLKLLARAAGGASGVSHAIACQAGAVERFRVAVLDTLRAGEPFTLRLWPEDAYGNRVTDYVNQQEILQLYTNGSGRLLPGTVDPSMFSDGQAELQGVYTRAEAVEIMARPLGVKDGAAVTLDELLVLGGGGDQVIIRLIGNGRLEVAEPRLVQPRLLVLDLPKVRVIGDQRRLNYTSGPVAMILLTQESSDPVPVARLTIALNEAASYAMTASGNIVTLTCEQPSTAAGLVARPPVPAATVAAETAATAGEFEPGRTVDYYLTKAEGFIRLEKYSEALRQVELALRLEPANARALELERRLRRLIVLFH